MNALIRKAIRDLIVNRRQYVLSAEQTTSLNEVENLLPSNEIEDIKTINHIITTVKLRERMRYPNSDMVKACDEIIAQLQDILASNPVAPQNQDTQTHIFDEIQNTIPAKVYFPAIITFATTFKALTRSIVRNNPVSTTDVIYLAITETSAPLTQTALITVISTDNSVDKKSSKVRTSKKVKASPQPKEEETPVNYFNSRYLQKGKISKSLEKKIEKIISILDPIKRAKTTLTLTKAKDYQNVETTKAIIDIIVSDAQSVIDTFNTQKEIARKERESKRQQRQETIAKIHDSLVLGVKKLGLHGVSTPFFNTGVRAMQGSQKLKLAKGSSFDYYKETQLHIKKTQDLMSVLPSDVADKIKTTSKLNPFQDGLYGGGHNYISFSKIMKAIDDVPYNEDDIKFLKYQEQATTSLIARYGKEYDKAYTELFITKEMGFMSDTFIMNGFVDLMFVKMDETKKSVSEVFIIEIKSHRDTDTTVKKHPVQALFYASMFDPSVKVKFALAYTDEGKTADNPRMIFADSLDANTVNETLSYFRSLKNANVDLHKIQNLIDNILPKTIYPAIESPECKKAIDIIKQDLEIQEMVKAYEEKIRSERNISKETVEKAKEMIEGSMMKVGVGEVAITDKIVAKVYQSSSNSFDKTLVSIETQKEIATLDSKIKELKQPGMFKALKFSISEVAVPKKAKLSKVAS